MLEDVWAVVVHYGEVRATHQVLERLRSSTVPVRIVVPDNSGNLEPHDGIDSLPMESNLGFAAAANAGARHALDAGARWVWFVNNDAAPGPESLERLLETARLCSPACLVGSLEVDPRDADPQGEWANRAPMLPRRLRARVRSVRGRLGAVDFLSGFSVLVSRQAFDLVGFFDESFFHYFEDVDYSVRAVRAGADVVLDCAAPVVHQRATSLGRDSEEERYYFFRNRLLLAARYRSVHPLLALLLADPRNGLAPLVSRKRILGRDWQWLRGTWRGTLDAVRGRTGPISARHPHVQDRGAR